MKQRKYLIYTYCNITTNTNSNVNGVDKFDKSIFGVVDLISRAL
jgi:hypothetical protein